MADWHTRAIIYQIDSALFYDLNGDGCGDIAGMTAKLRYIRRMGATVIWITPFYLTPFLDEGYDVSDHLQVDPRFGQLADIIAFIEQARELGMQVIIELLIQHTSDAHPWFQQARRSRRSPFRDYYLWSDNDDDDTPPMFPGVEESIWSGMLRPGNIIGICFIVMNRISTWPRQRSSKRSKISSFFG